MRNLKTSKLISLGILLLLLVYSCTEKKGFDINDLITRYSKNPNDSIKLQAAQFLKENLENQISEKLISYNRRTGNKVELDFDTINTSEKLKSTIEYNQLILKTVKKEDINELNVDFIESEIDAFNLCYHKLPWTRKTNKDVLFNYLLPYKICWEEPGDWRNVLFEMNKTLILKEMCNVFIDSISRTESPAPLINFVNNGDVFWFEYGNVSINDADISPSFKWIKCVRKGDCYMEANYHAYTLRSMGIPATVDYIPMWGSKNAGHATAVALDKNGNVYPKYKVSGAAKVFRFTFKKHSIWTKQIKPLTGVDSFLIPSIKHDQWVDVTSAHQKTTNLRFTVPENTKKKFAYICVYNYGQWSPVFWGKIDQHKKVVFNNMTRNILYCLAFPNGNSYTLYGQPFLLDTAGNVKYYNPAFSKKVQLVLTKVNTGSSSWVKKGQAYTLSYLDTNNQWNDSLTKLATKDSLIAFDNIPTNSLYILRSEMDEHNLSRPFIYLKGEQMWY